MEYRIVVKERFLTTGIRGPERAHREREDMGLLVESDCPSGARRIAVKELDRRLGGAYDLISIGTVVGSTGLMQAVIVPKAGPVMPHGAQVGVHGPRSR